MPLADQHPGEEDFCFCGNQPLDGLPYCAGHSRLAYQAGSRLRAGGDANANPLPNAS